ncbi:alpha/beta hydrolase [Lignipirellula cremea]|uniref:Acetyl esterase n=1 Tax=Lignipirellula cremea TaxID=2528010 RepID=A0A518DV91_9BACT|nr:alpha/beta hydrolase [Lignipirellula cremea]QDU95747.1 acetyl esterase [Lignipirellula cremea]
MKTYRLAAWALLALPFLANGVLADDAATADQPAAGQAVQIVRDVPYLGKERAEKLDLYLPPAAGKDLRYPGVVIIHGGGWTSGDKGAAREQNIGTTLAQAGYVCASINYLLSDQEDKIFPVRLAAVWPQNLYDCKTAVRFLRANADKYQIDVDHIGAIGGSAGGHLTGMLGLTGPEDKLDPAGPYGEFSCRVQAIVPMYGPSDMVLFAKGRKFYDKLPPEQQALCVASSPVTYISDDDPPVLILHGTADALVPVEQSQVLHDALIRAGHASQIEIVPKAPHSFHLQPAQKDLRPLVLGFFDKHLQAQ